MWCYNRRQFINVVNADYKVRHALAKIILLLIALNMLCYIDIKPARSDKWNIDNDLCKLWLIYAYHVSDIKISSQKHTIHPGQKM